MKILELIGRIRDQISIAMAFMLIFGLLVVLPFALPVIAASIIKVATPVLVIIAGIIYFIIWFVAFFMMIDSTAYIYGFRRPFIVPYKRFYVGLGTPTVKSPFDFVKTTLISYALTLYGFSVAYILISTINHEAFNIKVPLDFLTAVYFTVVTAATVGYGDITPTSPLARSLVTIEIIVSFLYIVFIFSTVASFRRTPSNGSSPKNRNQRT